MFPTLGELARKEPEQARREAGGKAATLAGLVGLGLQVPPGFVIPTAVLSAHLRRCGLSGAAARGEDIRARLLAQPLSRGLARSLDRAAAALGSGPELLLAVRSSAVGEDGAEASHAGQYLTLLGIRRGPELEQAILRCWASAWDERALAYRDAHGQRAHRTLPMALLVQVLIEPRCAGVLFTVNPATGSWREMIVEAAWGQGEAVVSGRIVPELHRVRRPRRSPSPIQRVLARVRLRPEPAVPGDQPFELVVDRSRPRGELLQRPLSAERRASPVLSTEELLGLCRLGLRIESRQGQPQDIEWALDPAGRLWVTQARPVTAGADVRRAGPTVWSRRFVGERWTRPATPLGWSLMRELLEHFIAYPETTRRYLGGDPPTRLLRFAPYINVTVFRHLAFKAPGFAPPHFLIELLPPEEERTWLRRRDQAPDLRVYVSILAETARERRWQRFRWNLFTNDRAWAQWVPTMEARLRAMEGPIHGRSEALAQTVACAALAREYVKIHVCSLLFANIWYEAAQAALEAQPGGGGEELVALLLRPPEHSVTVRLNQDLWALGQGTLPLVDFLHRHGHRADGSWELFSPRWAEEPEAALVLARSAAMAHSPPADEDAEARRIDQALRTLGPGQRGLVSLARRFLALRESQRECFDRIAWRWKRAWLWLEAEQGMALRFLEQGEVRSLIDGELPRDKALDLIARRQAEWEEEVQRRALGDEPPLFLIGEEEAEQHEEPAAQLSGLGVGPGVATGPARIVHTLADAHRLRPGDILVARATDPAWTPLFLNARGLVLESGGMLSHGAVVAREYRLPAVTNVRDATRRLQDGQTITVDGGRGRVFVR